MTTSIGIHDVETVKIHKRFFSDDHNSFYSISINATDTYGKKTEITLFSRSNVNFEIKNEGRDEQGDERNDEQINIPYTIIED